MFAQNAWLDGKVTAAMMTDPCADLMGMGGETGGGMVHKPATTRIPPRRFKHPHFGGYRTVTTASRARPHVGAHRGT
jgi:hypothetical protein